MKMPEVHTSAMQTPNDLSQGAREVLKRIPNLRWWIIGLIFLITCINYVDRSSIGLLVTRFGPELGVTSREYGFVGATLLFAYTLSQSVSGRLYDQYGARVGFTVSVIVWCAAAMGHAAITGLESSIPQRSCAFWKIRRWRSPTPFPKGSLIAT